MARLFCVVVLSLCSAASARCASEWLSVEPAAGVAMTTMPHVLVTLGGTHQSLAPAKLSFVAGPQRVAVEVVRSFDGVGQKLVLVRPAKALRPGAWELVAALPKQLRRFGPWTVSAAPDPLAPGFLGRPTLGALDWQEYGCGPGSSVDVQQVGRTEPGYVEAAATVAGVTTTAVLSPANEALGLGHGMCAGAFSFPPGARVSVVLTPLDYAGNRGTPAAPLTFTAPGPPAPTGDVTMKPNTPSVVIGQARYEEDPAFPGFLFARAVTKGELLFIQQVFRQRVVAGRPVTPVRTTALRHDEKASELVLEDSAGRTHHVAMKEKERGSHWPAQVELVSQAPLKVRLTIPNPGSRPLALDGVSVCEDGRVENSVFTLSVDGVEVPYQGMMRKRAPPDGFVMVKPGKAFVVEVPLTDWEVPPKGTLSIRFETFNHFSKDEVQLVSNELVVER